MTALQTLYAALSNTRPEEWVIILLLDKEKLLELEKQQIIEAYKAGIWDLGCNNPDHDRYYNETYNK